MISLGERTRTEAGFVIKHCVLCLTHRLHAVDVSRTEFAGFAYSTKATLVCSNCGLEREVGGEAATQLIQSAVPHDAIFETLSREALEGDLGGTRPAGTEWLVPGAGLAA